MTLLQKSLRAIAIIGVFLLPFVPFLVTSTLFFPYITGKNFAFRAIVEVMTGAWLTLALLNEKYRPRREWILGALALFILVMAIADAQGANAFKSFWSNYERMDGWITIAHLLAYTVVASIVMHSERLWRTLFQISLAVSVYFSIDGLEQILGYQALGAGGAGGLAARVDATFGNPIYLAVYMLFHIFIAVLLMVQMYARRKYGERLFPTIAYSIVIFCDTVALFFTGTRGTMLGLIGGGLLSLAIYAFYSGRRVRTIAIGICVGIIVTGGLLVSARNTTFVHSIGFLDRLASISLSDNTTHARFLNMGIALQGFKERPIFGWGQENYAIVFDKYYDPRMYAQEPWFDRTHNIIFDWLIAGGIVGLLSYLSIFAATLYTLWLRNRRGEYTFTIAERSILTGVLAGYFIHNLTVFDNVTSYILFGTILAYIVCRHTHALETKPLIAGEIVQKNMIPVIALMMVGLTGIVLWLVNSSALAQNQTLLQAISLRQGPDATLTAIEQSIAYGSYGTQEAREQLIQLAQQVVSAPEAQVSSAIKQQFFTVAVKEMSLQEAQSPLDARFPLFIGILKDVAGDLEGGRIALLRAHTLSPQKQSIIYEIAQNAQLRGDMKGAEEDFKQAFELDTDNNQARINYVTAAIRSHDDALADGLLAPLLSSGGLVNQQLAAAYASRNQYGKIVSVWSRYIASNPDDASAYVTLAIAYYQSGNPTEAINTLHTLAKAVPSSTDQAQSLIAEIQKGTGKKK